MLRNFDPLLYKVLLEFIAALGYLFMQSSLKVWLQHFSQVEVCPLSGPLEHISFFFSHSVVVVDMLWDHCPAAWPSSSQALAVREVASNLTLKYFGIDKSSWSTQWLRDAQVLLLQNKSKSSTLHHCAWQLVYQFVLLYCAFFILSFFPQTWHCELWPKISTLVLSIKRTLFQCLPKNPYLFSHFHFF